MYAVKKAYGPQTEDFRQVYIFLREGNSRNVLESYKGELESGVLKSEIIEGALLLAMTKSRVTS